MLYFLVPCVAQLQTCRLLPAEEEKKWKHIHNAICRMSNLVSEQEELGLGICWHVVDQAAVCLLVPAELRFEFLALFLPSPSDGRGYVFRVEGPIRWSNLSSGEVSCFSGTCILDVVERLLRFIWQYDYYPCCSLCRHQWYWQVSNMTTCLWMIVNGMGAQEVWWKWRVGGWLSRSCRVTLVCTTAVGNRILVSMTMEPSFRIDDCFKETGST